MTDRATLARLGKLVAEDVAAGLPGPNSQAAAQFLEGQSDAVLDLVDLVVAEARRKRPSQKLVSAYVYLIGRALEFVRYGAENGHARATQVAENVRRSLLHLAASRQIEPSLLLMILGAFSDAKLDPGDELRRLMADLAEETAGRTAIGVDSADLDSHLRSLAAAACGDAFVLHAEMLHLAEAFPEEHRAAMGAMMLRSGEPAAREAAVGWLLDASARVRNVVAAAIEQAAPTGVVSGTMLRRLIALRNWLPEADRASLDRAIQACRRKGTECAPWPQAQVREVVASAVDGAGAQSVFLCLRARAAGMASDAYSSSAGLACGMPGRGTR